MQTADTLALPTPKVHLRNGRCSPPRPAQAGPPSAVVRAGSVPAEKDNMLLITNDGRKIAPDQRPPTPRCPTSRAAR
ncbi:MAG: hypothetical protein ACLSVD_01600 [Eggerthellaceae bacterium]